MAVRNYDIPIDAVFHSDRGSNYASRQFGETLSALRIRQSGGRTGICHDNSMAEIVLRDTEVFSVRTSAALVVEPILRGQRVTLCRVFQRVVSRAAARSPRQRSRVRSMLWQRLSTARTFPSGGFLNGVWMPIPAPWQALSASVGRPFAAVAHNAPTAPSALAAEELDVAAELMVPTAVPQVDGLAVGVGGGLGDPIGRD